MPDWEAKQYGKEAFKNLAIFANGTSRASKEGFLEAFHEEHPTIQQSVMRLMVGMIRVHSKRQYVDDRNKASVALCKKILDLLDYKDTALPLI